MIFEPVSRERRNFFQRAGLLEKVTCVWNDFDSVICGEFRSRLIVQLDDKMIVSANDQERGRMDLH
jgi:hypothetical protein